MPGIKKTRHRTTKIAPPEVLHHQLTPGQARFVEEYVVDLNARAAMERAGYSPISAGEMLRKPHVAEAIRQRQAELSRQTFLDATWVIERLKIEAVYAGEGATHTARVRALDLLGRHLGLFDGADARTTIVQGPTQISQTNVSVAVSAGPVQFEHLTDDQLRQFCDLLGRAVPGALPPAAGPGPDPAPAGSDPGAGPA